MISELLHLQYLIRLFSFLSNMYWEKTLGKMRLVKIRPYHLNCFKKMFKFKFFLESMKEI